MCSLRHEAAGAYGETLEKKIIVLYIYVNEHTYSREGAKPTRACSILPASEKDEMKRKKEDFQVLSQLRGAANQLDPPSAFSLRLELKYVPVYPRLLESPSSSFRRRSPLRSDSSKMQGHCGFQIFS